MPGWPEVPTLFQFIVGDLCLGAAFAGAFLKIEKKRALTAICAALYVALALVLVWEAVVFGATAVGAAPFVVAAILAAAAAGIEGMPLRKKTCKPGIALIAFGLILSMLGLSFALKTLPLGTSYAVWVGIGAMLTVVYGMLTGEESVSAVKVVLIAGLVACIVGLKAANGETAAS